MRVHGAESLKARGFVVDAAGRPAPGVTVTASVELEDGRRVPLGALVSDGAGYVSFDLSTAARMARPATVSVEPLGEGRPAVAFSYDAQQDPGPFTLRVTRPKSPCTGCGTGASTLPAVQNPDAVDWVLSPGSLVTPRPTTRLGEGDCAVPVRSVLPVRRIGYVQVSRSPVATEGDRGPGRILPHGHGAPGSRSGGAADPGTAAHDVSLVLDPFAPVATPQRPVWLPCDIHFYEQTWSELGECLGGILYSLPLAPCESVNVAVIEASRQDTVRRQDEIASKEELDHSVFRDRTIDESVEGALREKQGGWSLMGGHAGSYSGSWANVGTFSAVHSLGGAVSHSWGRRTVEAETTQELHDSVVQATDAVRTLSSTVVVQAGQDERHRAETRTVTNHNHCHALTVQYYEVLRQFRLETRLLRSRPGVLVPYAMLDFAEPYPEIRLGGMGHDVPYVLPPERDDLHLVNRLRPLLEGSLLSPALDANFAAVRRLLFFSQVEPPQAPLPTPGEHEVDSLTVKVKRGQWGTGPRSVSLRIRLADRVAESNYLRFRPSPGMQNKSEYEAILMSPAFEGDLGDDEDYEWVGPWTLGVWGKVPRGLLAEAEIHWSKPSGDLTSDFSLRGLDIRTFAPGGEETLVQQDLDKKFQEEGFMPFPVAPPPKESDAQQQAADEARRSAERKRQQAQDEALAWELLTHLHDHRDHYSRALVATKDPTWFAEALDEACGGNPALRERVDGVPVAVSGQYLVFPVNSDPQPTGTAPVCTDVVSLPGRGVFAEAQLGGCNACEKRDPTRFWKWEESPCEKASAIEGVTPGFKGTLQNLGQPQLPGAVVQITQPPAAPDPTGLAAALTLLGKGDAFRDMSGLPELSQLLQGLASGAIDLAQAQRLAAQVNDARSRDASGGAGGSGGTGGGGRDPAFEPDAERQIDRLDALDYAKEKDLIDDEGARTAAKNLLGGAIASTDAGLMPDAGSRLHWNAYVYVVGSDKEGEKSDFNVMARKLMAETRFVTPWVNITYDYRNSRLRKTWKASEEAGTRDESYPLTEFILYDEIARMASFATIRHLHLIAHSWTQGVGLTYTGEDAVLVTRVADLRAAPPGFGAAFDADSVIKVHGCARDEEVARWIGAFAQGGTASGALKILGDLRKLIGNSYAATLAEVTGVPVWAAPLGAAALMRCTYLQGAGERGRRFCVETDPNAKVHGFPNTLKFYEANYHRIYSRAAGEGIYDCTYHMKYKTALAPEQSGPAAALGTNLPPRGVCGRPAVLP